MDHGGDVGSAAAKVENVYHPETEQISLLFEGLVKVSTEYLIKSQFCPSYLRMRLDDLCGNGVVVYLIMSVVSVDGCGCGGGGGGRRRHQVEGRGEHRVAGRALTEVLLDEKNANRNWQISKI